MRTRRPSGFVSAKTVLASRLVDDRNQRRRVVGLGESAADHQRNLQRPEVVRRHRSIVDVVRAQQRGLHAFELNLPGLRAAGERQTVHQAGRHYAGQRAHAIENAIAECGHIPVVRILRPRDGQMDRL